MEDFPHISTETNETPESSSEKITKAELTKKEDQMKFAEKKLQTAKDDMDHFNQHQTRVATLTTEQKLIPWENVKQMMPKITSTAISMVLHSTPLKQVDRDPEKESILKSRYFDVTMPENVIPTNQMYSGRCWMFAGLNIFRRELIRSNKLQPNFELSQSYLFFWHYFEQYNDMLNLFYYEKIEPFEKAELLESPLHDGGNWITFRRLVCKYGIVPKSLYRESWPTSHSSEMNIVLSNLLRKDVRDCTRFKKEADFLSFREIRLEAVLEILCSFMGAPPMSKMEYVFENIQHKLVKCIQTPRSFFKSLDAAFDINLHIQLIHDMRKDSNKWYTTQHQSLQGTRNVIFNLHDTAGKMETWFKAVLESIRCKIPVWFACNMNEDVSSTLQGMADELYDAEKFINSSNSNQSSDSYNSLEMSKIDRMNWGRARCNHAMLIVGVETKNGKCQSFQIENSWGATGPGKGFYKMTAAWFRKHVFTIVIHRAILAKVGLDIPPRINEMEEYLFWDFFG